MYKNHIWAVSTLIIVLHLLTLKRNKFPPYKLLQPSDKYLLRDKMTIYICGKDSQVLKNVIEPQKVSRG